MHDRPCRRHCFSRSAALVGNPLHRCASSTGSPGPTASTGNDGTASGSPWRSASTDPSAHASALAAAIAAENAQPGDGSWRVATVASIDG
ncbi:MAG: hypothetical protein IPM08_03220 [Actinomycetales bacterium]|nr:hypothetical protein [Actinomycetales bacterium]